MRAAAVTALACMYAFSGYILMFYQNIVWLDAAYLFASDILGGTFSVGVGVRF